MNGKKNPFSSHPLTPEQRQIIEKGRKAAEGTAETIWEDNDISKETSIGDASGQETPEEVLYLSDGRPVPSDIDDTNTNPKRKGAVYHLDTAGYDPETDEENLEELEPDAEQLPEGYISESPEESPTQPIIPAVKMPMPEVMRRNLHAKNIYEQDAPPASATARDWDERHWIDSENTPTSSKKLEKKAVQAHTPLPEPSVFDRLRHRALVGFAAVASVFGVKMGLEKTGEAVKDAAEIGTALTAQNAQEGMSQGTYLVEAPQPKDAQPTELTQTYTIQKGDTLWGIANAMVAENGLTDPEGLLALKAVKSLREENGIEGNAATSKKMWAGATLVTSETAHLLAGVGKTELPKTARVTATSKSPQEHETLTATSAPKHPETLASAVPAELLSTTLAPGETVFSRTFHMLESVGLPNPNIAKRSVLSAIVLADSHMSEAQAMRIKPAGHKKFDPAKDTLDFSRAALAAADLKAGMSPAEVAKKYGVTNVYSKLRTR